MAAEHLLSIKIINFFSLMFSGLLKKYNFDFTEWQIVKYFKIANRKISSFYKSCCCCGFFFSGLTGNLPSIRKYIIDDHNSW